MLKYLNTKKLKWRGFTLIEMLVTMTISVLIIGAICGVFVSSIKGKQRIYQLKEIEDNARYAMELMSREIRMAQSINASDGSYDTLEFTNSSGGDVSYGLSGFSLINQDSEPITSDNVKITNLTFYINDTSAPAQSRVTISMTVASDDESVSMNFQTTISPRIY